MALSFEVAAMDGAAPNVWWMRYNGSMELRTHSRVRSASRLRLLILGAVLAGWGLVVFPGLAEAAQTSPQNDPANQHTITIKFDYDFQRNPSCAEKPALKTCVKQFVVYDVSGRKFKLFMIPVPDGARGLVKGITGESPMRVFLPGKHFIAVTAQNPDGVESQIEVARTMVEIKSKTADTGSPAK